MVKRYYIYLIIILTGIVFGLGGYYLGAKYGAIAPASNEQPSVSNGTASTSQTQASTSAVTSSQSEQAENVSSSESLSNQKIEKTCTDRTISSNVASPVNSLNPFFSALLNSFSNEDAKITVKCFFSSSNLYTKGSMLYRVNLDKNFSEFNFIVANWTPSNIVGVNVTDPELTSNIIYFYMKNEGGKWKIVDIQDPTGVLK